MPERLAAPAVPAMPTEPPPAVRAFGAVAEVFDTRFGDWASVAAQRRAVRRHLLAAFPPGSTLLELGGGTAEDALFLARHGREVLFTDGAASMVERARAKAEDSGLADRVRTEVLVLEDLEEFARDRRDRGAPLFDGAYSNFAALNCVPDLRPVARGLSGLLSPGARALLVLFGPFPPGEVLVQLVRGDPRAAFRRLRKGATPARLGGMDFHVWYPGPRQVARAFSPEFGLRGTRGIGIFVPPSAAEPMISRYPRALALMERLDRLAEAPLAWLGDHVLLQLERTGGPAPDPGTEPTPETTPETTPGPRPGPTPQTLRRFRTAYAEHRKTEGRGSGGEEELLALPYVRRGPQAKQWAVRSRTFDAFVSAVLQPCARAVAPRPLHVVDLGAGNAWLSYRVSRAGHRATAIDLRTDSVDGLGAAEGYRPHVERMPARIAGSFEALPLGGGVADMAVFNAALHYAFDLPTALREAARVVAPGGRVLILDSPFYSSAAHGEAMVEEKSRHAEARFGDRADDLLAPPFIEYLTPERLEEASAGLGLRWRRHRVRYPFRYELRPLMARLRGRRPPSRFDLWEGRLS